VDQTEKTSPKSAPSFAEVILKVAYPEASGPESAQREEILEFLTRIYETILTTTDDFVYIFDPEGRFLYANAPLLKVWAKTLPEVIGKTCYDLGYPTWHADLHTREIAEIVRTREPLRGEVPFTGDSGIFGIYDYIFKPVLDAAGNVEAIVGTTRDITARKESEEKLKAAQLELQNRADELEAKVAERTASLQESLGVLESFSYSIVHDMRAPLRSMQGYARILTEEHPAELGPEARVYLERIYASANRMDQLIQDVLSFSKISREEVTLRPVDADALLREILETYPDLLAGRNHIRIEGKLPVVIGNEAALTQCFSNLLSNALKFVRPGEPPEVCVRSGPVGERVRIYFDDRGPGIASHLHERIFELFQRASGSTDGTGIGLSIVKKSMERMGGKVGLESAPGEGSTFWLDFAPAPGSVAS
jgi:PAS domain S-box-containing protein